jgi:hypothetical protein
MRTLVQLSAVIEGVKEFETATFSETQRHKGPEAQRKRRTKSITSGVFFVPLGLCVFVFLMRFEFDAIGAQ